MQDLLPQFEVGQPITLANLAVFPLYRTEPSPLEYLLADEAIRSSAATVEEIGTAGSVPELLVRNPSSHMVLFVEGEEFLGAKQNRVLNTSVLVGAGKSIVIPVSCVEQGRWSSRSRHFAPSDHVSPAKLRSSLKDSVSRSLEANEGHRSDQRKVWQDVSDFEESLACSSPTSAMSETFAAYADRLNEAQAKFAYPKGAVGLAVANGGRVVSVDAFDQPNTCEKLWEKLLRGHLLEIMIETKHARSPSPAKIEKYLATVARLPWQQHPAVGEGTDHRARSKTALASALVVANTTVHVSILSA